MKKTNQTTSLKKKTFVKPQMKAVQIQSESIMTGSGGGSGAQKTATAKTEEYTRKSTPDWF